MLTDVKGGKNNLRLSPLMLKNPLTKFNTHSWYTIFEKIAINGHFPKMIVHTHTWGFPGGSNGKESACNEGDLGSNLGLRRSPGEGND